MASRIFSNICARMKTYGLENLENKFQNMAIRNLSSTPLELDTDVPVVPDSATRVSRGPIPIITSRKLEYPPNFRKPRQVWVENLDTTNEEKLGIIDLHPDIFGMFPRLDLLQQNVEWQTKYKHVSYRHVKTRAEMRGGGRKPWPQKGTGRARHGSIRSPIWVKGGKSHGPRSPTTYFYMLPFYKRVVGLACALSVKLAQNDLRIVDSLEIPTDDKKYIESLVEERNWGPSVLFVDDTDIMPRNVSLATDEIGHLNLMPVYGLNVYSMLKHDTLVLTLAAIERIEEKLLYQLHRNDSITPSKKFRYAQV